MLQRLRDGLQGTISKVILGAIALTFIVWGGAGSIDFTGVGDNVAAEVEGEDVEAQQVERTRHADERRGGHPVRARRQSV